MNDSHERDPAAPAPNTAHAGSGSPAGPAAPARRPREWLRTVAAVVLLAGALGAYVWYRRSQLQASQAAVAPGEISVTSSGPARGGLGGPAHDSQGDESEEGPEGSPEGGRHGHKESPPPDPAKTGPPPGSAARTVCLQQATPGPHALVVTGTTSLGPSAGAEGGPTVVVATDVPISEWSKQSRIQLFAHDVTTGGAFTLHVKARVPAVWICALQTSAYPEYGPVHAGVCHPRTLQGAASSDPLRHDNVQLELAQLPASFSMMGWPRVTEADAWPGTELRHLGGSIRQEGSESQRVFVVIATVPLLDGQHAEAGPLAVVMSDAAARFSASVLAAPGDTLYACAFSLRAPPLRSARSQCQPVTHPAAGVGQPNVANRVTLAIREDLEFSLANSERDYFNFLAGCLN